MKSWLLNAVYFSQFGFCNPQISRFLQEKSTNCAPFQCMGQNITCKCTIFIVVDRRLIIPFTENGEKTLALPSRWRIIDNRNNLYCVSDVAIRRYCYFSKISQDTNCATFCWMWYKAYDIRWYIGFIDRNPTQSVRKCVRLMTSHCIRFFSCTLNR